MFHGLRGGFVRRFDKIVLRDRFMRPFQSTVSILTLPSDSFSGFILRFNLMLLVMVSFDVLHENRKIMQA